VGWDFVKKINWERDVYFDKGKDWWDLVRFLYE
jgi:hypothetical protein